MQAHMDPDVILAVETKKGSGLVGENWDRLVGVLMPPDSLAKRPPAVMPSVSPPPQRRQTEKEEGIPLWRSCIRRTRRSLPWVCNQQRPVLMPVFLFSGGLIRTID